MRALTYLAILLAAMLIVPQASAYNPSDSKVGKDVKEMNCTKKINFPYGVKKRLDNVYHEIYMGYVDLIETYAWAGALTNQQKELRMRMLKNYIRTFQKRNYQWCSEHEPDEWEEEWFNSDND